MPNTHLRVLTNSELRVRRRCAREHWYMYSAGYRSVGEDAHALRFGSLIHLGLEHWWRAREQKLQHALSALPLDTDPYDLARATELLRGYDIRWAGEPLETIAVETQFRAPLVNPYTGQASRTFELAGKLDALALNTQDGRVYLVEHKTSGDDLSTGSDYWRALTLDTQVSTYYVGARALGHDVAGAVYDVIGKPKLRPLEPTPVLNRKYKRDGSLHTNQRDRAETPEQFQLRIREEIAAHPDRYLVRGTVVRLELEEQDAAWDTWSIARCIREDELAQRWPRNPDACRRFGRMCSYFGVCTGVEELTDPHLFRKVADVHEELAPPPAEEAPRVTH